MELVYSVVSFVVGFPLGGVFAYFFLRKNPNFLKNSVAALKAKQAKLQAVVDAVKDVAK